MRYRVHRLDVNIKRDQAGLEHFLNSLTGEVVAIVPGVSLRPFWVHRVDFLLVVERTTPSV
jgi:hypothetical protein